MLTPSFFYILTWIVALGSIVISVILRKIIATALNTPNNLGLSGADLIKKASQMYGIPIKIKVGKHWLGDYFDPRTNTINLSVDVATTKSVGAIAIAAHEFGHALQKQNRYWPLNIRNLLVPIVNIGTNLGTYIFFIGLAIGALGLAQIGLYMFGLAVIFTLLDLPIEFDASMRALKLLKKNFHLDPEDEPYVKRVLFWAAMTYVAAFANALINFLYMLSILRNNRD